LLADEPAAFAEAVVGLLDRPEDAHALAKHGEQTVRRLYSWDAVTAHFQQLLRELSPTGDQELVGSGSLTGREMGDIAT